MQCIRISNTQSTVLIALSFKYIMQLGNTVSHLMVILADLESSMVSIKRCTKLLEIPQEKTD